MVWVVVQGLNYRTMLLRPLRTLATTPVRSLARKSIPLKAQAVPAVSDALAETKSVIPTLDWDRGGRSEGKSLPPLYDSTKILMLKNPGCVCLIQVGGFYELYFEQAEIYAPKLGLKLSGKKIKGYFIPFAGFPLYQLQKYVRLLVQDIQKNVAIVDQYPNSAIDTSTILHRKVSRIISPGTLVDESFMNFQLNNYLLSISLPTDLTQVSIDPDCAIGLSWIDLSVGEFYVQKTTLADILADVARINPSEIILPKELQNETDGKLFALLQELRKYFLRFHQTTSSDMKLKFKSNLQVTRKALEEFSVRETAAMNMILSYIKVNLPEANLSLDVPTQFWNDKYLQMDARTREALELTHRSTGGRTSVIGSLLVTIKRTATASGTRLLTQWIKSPILDVKELQYRQQFVTLFLQNNYLQLSLRSQLAKIEDCARSLQRLSISSGDVGVHLMSIADSLTKLNQLEKFLLEEYTNNPVEFKVLKTFLKDFEVPMDEANEILDTLHQEENTTEDFIEEETPSEIVEEISESGSYGNSSIEKYKTTEPTEEVEKFTFSVKRDYNATLSDLHDQLESLRQAESIAIDEVRSELLEIEGKLSIKKKLQHNRLQNVLHITGLAKLIELVEGVLGEGVREKRKLSIVYKPNNWSKLQLEIQDVEQDIKLEEARIIELLRNKVLAQVIRIRKIGKMADFLDVTSSFSILAAENDLVPPKFVKTPQIRIEGGRHLVVESGLKQVGRMFLPNDTKLGSTAGNLWVISGPNMGGKSTFLRQNALIVILAQIGSFVPAEKATLGVVDKIFTRIGASDDLFSDLSTFMVEMVETSNILQNATSRSLAIVDEIGRGTSGKEGLAIAYATLVNLLQVNKCRTLFATHFGKELESMLTSNKIDQKKIRYLRTKVLDPNSNLRKKSQSLDMDLIIDHTLEPGISERSYALEVAQMAGFPVQALKDAFLALEKMDK